MSSNSFEGHLATPDPSLKQSAAVARSTQMSGVAIRKRGLLLFGSFLTMQAPKPPIARSIVTAVMVAPTSAFAASGRTFEGVLYIFLAVSAVVLLIWAAYYFSPVHRHFMRRDGDYKRVLLPILGLVALAFGTTAVVTGEVFLTKSISVLRALEPKLFWRYVALQLGAGCILILLGLLYPTRKS